MARSSAACSSSPPRGRPMTSRASSPFAFATAFSTPLPRNRLGSPSRSSSASREPVDAPDGTAALARRPSDVVISTATVGLPRESRISRADTAAIVTSAILTPVRNRAAGEASSWRPKVALLGTTSGLPSGAWITSARIPNAAIRFSGVSTSAGLPQSSTRPSASNARRSDARADSERSWEITSALRPSRAKSRTRSRTATRWARSR